MKTPCTCLVCPHCHSSKRTQLGRYQRGLMRILGAGYCYCPDCSSTWLVFHAVERWTGILYRRILAFNPGPGFSVQEAASLIELRDRFAEEAVR